MRFEWDSENVEHVRAHGLEPQQVEAIVLAGGFVTSSVEGRRVVGHGKMQRRTFRVVFDVIRKDVARVVTAFQISRKRGK